MPKYRTEILGLGAYELAERIEHAGRGWRLSHTILITPPEPGTMNFGEALFIFESPD